MKKIIVGVGLFGILVASIPVSVDAVSTSISTFKARPPIHVLRSGEAAPHGLNPAQIKAIYHLPASGGKGTIALIGAHDDPTIEADLNAFSKQFGLPACTTANGCFEKHVMTAKTTSSSDWSLETSLDVEWAHAIAPTAKILLVEAHTTAGNNLLAAVDYARSRSDVVAISMSWGGAEFKNEASLDSHFTSKYGAVFFASSGDSGAGVSWPAASGNVVAVGGTEVSFNATTGAFQKESAWSGSGGGVSAFEPEPDFQKSYSIPKANGKRAVPDVSYDADPDSGFSVYRGGSWYVIGGTSAGAPQWAAIRSLGASATNVAFYSDKASATNASYFRDIVSGANGTCNYYCDARRRYDYVTGLGSPLTVHF